MKGLKQEMSENLKKIANTRGVNGRMIRKVLQNSWLGHAVACQELEGKLASCDPSALLIVYSHNRVDHSIAIEMDLVKEYNGEE